MSSSVDSEFDSGRLCARVEKRAVAPTSALNSCMVLRVVMDGLDG